jgi:cell division protein FtsL
MEDYIWIFIIIGIAIIWGVISWIIETISNSKKYLELKPKLDNVENSIKEHELQITEDKTKIEAASYNYMKILLG